MAGFKSIFGTEENSEQHSENEGRQIMTPRIRRRIGEAAVLALFFIADALGFWPDSHGRALLIGAVGTCAVLFIELPLRSWIIASAVVGISTGGIYWIVGPNSVPEVEVIGSLQPGNEPTPPNGCDRTRPPGFKQIPQDAVRILFGDNAVVLTEIGKTSLVRIGPCHPLSVERTANGISFTAELYDAKGKLIARLANGELHVLTSESVHWSHDGDLSVLTIKDGSGNELLHIHHLNPTAMQVRGVFSCPSYRQITVRDSEPIAGFSFSGMCSVDNGTLVGIGPEHRE